MLQSSHALSREFLGAGLAVAVMVSVSPQKLEAQGTTPTISFEQAHAAAIARVPGFAISGEFKADPAAAQDNGNRQGGPFYDFEIYTASNSRYTSLKVSAVTGATQSPKSIRNPRGLPQGAPVDIITATSTALSVAQTSATCATTETIFLVREARLASDPSTTTLFWKVEMWSEPDPPIKVEVVIDGNTGAVVAWEVKCPGDGGDDDNGSTISVPILFDQAYAAAQSAVPGFAVKGDLKLPGLDGSSPSPSARRGSRGSSSNQGNPKYTFEIRSDSRGRFQKVTVDAVTGSVRKSFGNKNARSLPTTAPVEMLSAVDTATSGITPTPIVVKAEISKVSGGQPLVWTIDLVIPNDDGSVTRVRVIVDATTGVVVSTT